MRPSSTRVLALLACTAAAWMGASSIALAQPAPTPPPDHPIPQSLVFEHQETLDRLTALTKRPGQVGVLARKALELFTKHTAREQEYILPPLALLPDLADGKVTPDMSWALAMADRVKADREEIFQEHVAVTDVMNQLLVAGEREHDAEAVDFARSAAGDSLNDLELLEPTVMLIGDYLRAKLPPSH
ncbi:MAG: hypothetical protein ACHP84_01985 [Caulobacterales bacterium]|jgi:hypothetical protein